MAIVVTKKIVCDNCGVEFAIPGDDEFALASEAEEEGWIVGYYENNIAIPLDFCPSCRFMAE